LAAIQILPTAELVDRSTRAAYSVPRTLYEAREFFSPRTGSPLPNVAPAELFTGLLAHPDHVGATYQFSIGPWRWLEFLYPNFYGCQFPIHHRWIARLPAEQGDPWVPSLYVGLPAMLLALAGFRFRSHDLTARLFTWTLVLSLLAGCGVYGLGYLARATMATPPGNSLFGDAVGGLYWLMNVALPGYGYFRYPGKWLVVSSLAIAVLAARGWDRLLTKQRTLGATAGLPSSETPPLPLGEGRGEGAATTTFTLHWLRGVLCFAIASLLGAGLSYLLQEPLTAWFAAAPADVLFGPLDPHGAWRDVTTSLLQAGLVALALAYLVRIAARASHPSTLLTVLVLTLVAADLWFANRWLVATVPAADLHRSKSWLRELISDEDAKLRRLVDLRRGFLRLQRSFQQNSSASRLSELALYQHGALIGHYPLSYRLAVIAPGHTFELVDFANQPLNHLSLYSDWPLWRARAIHNWYCIAPTKSRDAATSALAYRRREYVKEQIANALQARYWNLMGVEIDEPARIELDLPAEQLRYQHVDNQTSITHYAPDRVELDVTMKAPGIVFLGDQFYPGWNLTLKRDDWPAPRPTPILRTNRIYRGAWLAEPGHYRLVYRYQPASFTRGATLSLAAWSFLLICCLGLCFRGWAKNSEKNPPAPVDFTPASSSAL